MTRTHALAVTVAEATKTKEEVGNCRKELHAMVKRLSTMKRQLLAQKEYIEVAVKDALTELDSKSSLSGSPYNGKSIKDKIVDYRVKLYKHRAFIGRLQVSDIIDDMHASTPADSNEIIAGYDRAIKSGGGLKVPIFNSSQILPGVTTSVDDPERIAETTEVFNGVDIIGTKQFLIGVNSILTHPNNISETLVPAMEVVSPVEEKRSYSTVWADNDIGTGHARSEIGSDQAWSAKTHPTNPSLGRPFKKGQEWMKIELPSVKWVTGVVTQGRTAGAVQYVKTLTVETSIIDNTNGSLVDSGKIFDANTLSALSTLKTIPFEQPVLAKYVKIYPQTYYGHPSMRAGVLVPYGGGALEDTPYERMDTASDLRKFNTGTNPYTPGLKHALSTGVLKGLLMQGNKNITGLASYTTIVNAIPDSGFDVITSDTTPFTKIRGFGLD